tara:strand:- start:251 stop:844 length:594 start_codon:yes stop_codon:yes gene_type:complete
MTDKYFIIDNFLSKKELIFLTDNLIGEVSREPLSPFKWKCQDGIVSTNNKTEYELDNYMFSHMFFSDEPFVISDYIHLVLPILSELGISKLYRIKSNFYPRTEKIIKHDWHVDRGDEHLSAIFYVNSNNGKTIIENEVEVESIENRLLIFDGTLRHASTSASDNFRMNINFNFNSHLDLKKVYKSSITSIQNNISYT